MKKPGKCDDVVGSRSKETSDNVDKSRSQQEQKDLDGQDNESKKQRNIQDQNNVNNAFMSPERSNLKKAQWWSLEDPQPVCDAMGGATRAVTWTASRSRHCCAFIALTGRR